VAAVICGGCVQSTSPMIVRSLVSGDSGLAREQSGNACIKRGKELGGGGGSSWV
jgi:hypothetical protein